MSAARGRAFFSVFHASGDTGGFVHLWLESAGWLVQGNLSGCNHACLEINAAQRKATAWEWMRGRKGKGRGNKAKRRKDLVLYQERARALNLNLSCSYLKERACDKYFGRRVCLSEVESWGYLPSFSVVAVLSILIHTCPGVIPAWASVPPPVQGSAAACGDRGDGASTSCYASVWGAACQPVC